MNLKVVTAAFVSWVGWEAQFQPLALSSFPASPTLTPLPVPHLPAVIKCGFFRQLFLHEPFPLLPPPSPSAWSAHFSWQGPDSLPMNLCSKREEKKCKKQILPAGQARGAASGPGSETALAGFLPESSGALECLGGQWGPWVGGGGAGKGRDPQKVRMGWPQSCGVQTPSSETAGSPRFSWVSRTCGFGVWSCGCLDSELTAGRSG